VSIVTSLTSLYTGCVDMMMIQTNREIRSASVNVTNRFISSMSFDYINRKSKLINNIHNNSHTISIVPYTGLSTCSVTHSTLYM